MLDKLVSLFSYSKMGFTFIWKRSKEYILLITLNIIMEVARVFPPMYLASWSIDLLTRNVDFKQYIKVILLIILLILSLTLISSLISSRLAYVKKKTYDEIKLHINKICLNTNYENVQSKTFLEKKNMAIESLNSGCLDMLIISFQRLVSGLFVMVGVMYIISKVSFLILLPVAVSLLIGFYYDYLNARQTFVDTKESAEFSRKSSYLQHVSSDFSFAKEIRLFNLKDCFKKRMDEVDELRYKLKEIRRKQRDIPVVLFYFADTVLDISLYLYLGFLVLVTQSITLGHFSIYYQSLRKLKDSANDIVYVFTEFAVNSEYLRAFFDFISYETIPEENDIFTDSMLNAEIRFEHVYYRYQNATEFTLKDINITLKSGETVLIVGENGAGKSTFVKLLCGLYKPTLGKIYINGKDISTISDDQYRSYISAVFQDYNLFAFSIEENISALSVIEKNKIIEALKKVNLLNVVDNTPRATESSLYRLFDPNGVEFSGGEMQRLAIARAIYKNAPILVLDEPTSALDPKAEYEIYKSFKTISEKRTAVYVSHRLSSVNFSDMIMVFDNGCIVEYGSHKSLMEQNGLYAELYALQANLYNSEGGRAV